MSDEIPAEVWEIARGLRQRVVWMSSGSVEDIAEFIMAERRAEAERCAVIAEANVNHGPLDAASAIRSSHE